ncbi:MAG: sigma-54-dependent Fis family transcriptional regulator, partial [Shewanella sp.]
MEKHFYYESTLRLCSSLQLEKSLQSYFEYIRYELPIDGLFVNIFRKQFNDIQFIAHVNDTHCCTLDKCIPIPETMALDLVDP